MCVCVCVCVCVYACLSVCMYVKNRIRMKKYLKEVSLMRVSALLIEVRAPKGCVEFELATMECSNHQQTVCLKGCEVRMGGVTTQLKKKTI